MAATRRVFLTGTALLASGAAGWVFGQTKTAEGSPMIRIAVVTDVHHARTTSGTRGSLNASRLLGNFATWVNANSIDVVVDCGDNVQEESPEQDLLRFGELAAIYGTMTPPVQHIPGNHDTRLVSLEQIATAFGGSISSRSEDRNGVHLVYFCPNVNNNGGGGFTYTQSELNWLANDLASTELPAIIFTHVPVHASSLVGNGYFPDTPGTTKGEFSNGHLARAIIKNSTTILVVAGHTHWNSWHVEDDIYYITIPSLSEMRRTPMDSSGSTALIEIDEKHISFEVRGRDSVAYKMRRRVGSSVWA